MMHMLTNSTNACKLAAPWVLEVITHEEVGSPVYPALHTQLNVLRSSAEQTASGAQLCKLALQAFVTRPGILRRFSLLHTRAVVSPDAVASLVPSGDQAIEKTKLKCPISVSSVLPLLLLQTRTVLS